MTAATRTIVRSSASMARAAPASVGHLLPHKVVPILWRQSLLPRKIADDYVMSWPSSSIPKRGRPAVRSNYSIDIHPSSSSARPRGTVAADFDYPFDLLCSQPAPTIKRRSNSVAAQLSADTSAWPVSPPACEAAVDESFVYEWPSSLAVRAARPRIADDSYIYEWPSSQPVPSKPCAVHVMNWAARP